MGKIEELEEYVESLNPVDTWSVKRDRVWADKSSLLYFVGKIKQQLKSSLPTQQDKVVVPEFVAEWIEHCRECSWSLRSAMLFENFGNFTDKRKLKKWFLDGKGRHDIFARAWLDGYTVEKEQLYIVKVGELAFVNWEDSMLAKMATMDSPGWVNEANHFTTKVRANEIAKIIGGEAVPVMEDE